MTTVAQLIGYLSKLPLDTAVLVFTATGDPYDSIEDHTDMDLDDTDLVEYSEKHNELYLGGWTWT